MEREMMTKKEILEAAKKRGLVIDREKEDSGIIWILGPVYRIEYLVLRINGKNLKIFSSRSYLINNFPPDKECIMQILDWLANY